MGRFANRIAAGKFTVGGTYHVATNRAFPHAHRRSSPRAALSQEVEISRTEIPSEFREFRSLQYQAAHEKPERISQKTGGLESIARTRNPSFCSAHDCPRLVYTPMHTAAVTARENALTHSRPCVAQARSIRCPPTIGAALTACTAERSPGQPRCVRANVRVCECAVACRCACAWASCLVLLRKREGGREMPWSTKVRACECASVCGGL